MFVKLKKKRFLLIKQTKNKQTLWKVKQLASAEFTTFCASFTRCPVERQLRNSGWEQMRSEITFSHIATPRRLHRSPCSFSCQEKNILESKYFYFSFIIEGFLFPLSYVGPPWNRLSLTKCLFTLAKQKYLSTVISSRCCFCCQCCCCWCWALGELSPSEYLSTCFYRLSRFFCRSPSDWWKMCQNIPVVFTFTLGRCQSWEFNRLKMVWRRWCCCELKFEVIKAFIIRN